ncbi:hypothetical protein AAHS21_25225 [Mycobacterium sp. 050272]|uniref:hypothetical protein n=1 Tax=Mycobacterium sp. 050272 TaxID=3142488 RepID=UPI00318C74C3
MSVTIVASPDEVPDDRPITKRLHQRILLDDGINPQARTTRALLAAIAELEAAIASQPKPQRDSKTPRLGDGERPG